MQNINGLDYSFFNEIAFPIITVGVMLDVILGIFCVFFVVFGGGTSNVGELN